MSRAIYDRKKFVGVFRSERSSKARRLGNIAVSVKDEELLEESVSMALERMLNVDLVWH